MTSVKRALATGATTLVLSAGLAVTAGPAAADTPAAGSGSMVTGSARGVWGVVEGILCNARILSCTITIPL